MAAALGASSPPERLGRYRLLEKLGQGGMASVYRARDDELRRDVAIKVVHPFLVEKGEGAARFEREARAVAALRHPAVMAVHDYVAADGEAPAYLVMELLAGPTLRRFVDEHGPPPPEVAAMVGVRVARALATAHAAGVVHRDVKPENVMLDRGGRVVLCDFGVARLAGADATMTATGAVIGSPAYMSPEQAAGEELDGRSDLFSLGTTLYLLATGALPFQAREPLALMAKIHRGEHKPPGAVNPRVPPYLERAIERCLRVDREARFADGDALAAALEGGLRADGLVDLEREIASYFADPPGYNAAHEPRIVEAALRAARAASAGGALEVAIGQCNRVLAWRPDDAEALALVARLGRRGGARRAALVAGAVVASAVIGAGAVLGGVAAFAAWRARGAAPTVAVAARGAASLGPATASGSAAPTAGGSAAATASGSAAPTAGGSAATGQGRAAEQASRDGIAGDDASTAISPSGGGGVGGADVGKRAPSGHRRLVASTATSVRGVASPRAAAAATAPIATVSAIAPMGAPSPAPGAVLPGAAPAPAPTPTPTTSPSAPSTAAAPPSVAGAPGASESEGEVRFEVIPYGNCTLDGRGAFREGQTARVAAGPHAVACTYAADGRTVRGTVRVVAGRAVPFRADFLAGSKTPVEVRLARGDRVALGDRVVSTGVTVDVAPQDGLEVRLRKAGADLEHRFVSVPAHHACVLRDDPRLELVCAPRPKP